MDVLLNEEEREIQSLARDFLQSESPPSLARESETAPTRHSAELWGAMGHLGWAGLSLPEAYGGQGQPLVMTGLLLEEVGRHLAPVPLHSTVVTSLALARHGSEELKEELLPEFAAGHTVGSVALQEESGLWTLDGLECTASPVGDRFVLNGTKTFVDDAMCADVALVVCSAPVDDGIVMLLVDIDSPGITVEPLVTTAKDGQGRLHFDGVEVPSARKLGGAAGRGIALDVMDLGTALLCSQLSGATRRDMEFGVAYSKQREAFGHPIGSFQSIQHMCADMLVLTDGIELLTRQAIWRLSEGLSAAAEVSLAKSFASEKAIVVCRSSQQIHGGIGFMMEFDLHLWYRRIASWSLRWGSSREHRRRVASALLDTPYEGELRIGSELALGAVAAV